ncbi:MAG: ParB/RepB/Spo0J family partition protein [Candidatus Liptonbacteria bacterium]|nr:ParB/RepB/Spo0J family partition protein [Candidatus Liptonbacteria bacterium]
MVNDEILNFSQNQLNQQSNQTSQNQTDQDIDELQNKNFHNVPKNDEEVQLSGNPVNQILTEPLNLFFEEDFQKNVQSVDQAANQNLTVNQDIAANQDLMINQSIKENPQSFDVSLPVEQKVSFNNTEDNINDLIIVDSPKVFEREEPKKLGAVFQIEVEKIFPNPHQPRRYFDQEQLKGLASSIREFGVIQPLVISKILKETETGTSVYYQLIAGERRLLAAKMVGLRTVPAIIKSISTEKEKLEISIIENIQRVDLNPIEVARAYAKLQDEFGITQREIGARLGKSRETVANTLRLLNLPSEIQLAVEQGKINESQARILLQIEDISKQREVFNSLLTKEGGGLTVRDLKEKIKTEIIKSKNINPEIEEIKGKLEEALGTKVMIREDGDKGKLVIDFYSIEELSNLAEKIIIKQNDNQFL